MSYYRVDFSTATNEDLRQSFQITDRAGTPINLTGAALHMDVADQPGHRALQATTDNGLIVLSGAPAGTFELAVPATLMRGLPPGVYQHDLLLLRGDRTMRVWSGTLSLARGVTQ